VERERETAEIDKNGIIAGRFRAVNEITLILLSPGPSLFFPLYRGRRRRLEGSGALQRGNGATGQQERYAGRFVYYTHPNLNLFLVLVLDPCLALYVVLSRQLYRTQLKR
jgi:hypothetical protein